MNESMKWQLLASYLSGECSSEEKENIENWMNADPDNQQLVEFLKIAWHTREPDIQTSDTNTLWQQLSREAGIDSGWLEGAIKPVKKPVSGRKKRSFPPLFSPAPIWRYAAIFLILLLSALYLLRGDFSFLPGIRGKTELKTIAVGNAQRDNIILADGSKITLDAGSKFSYPDKFRGDTREVHLAGEAFFEITSNPGKPFIVFVNQAAIEVLGTKFNIRAWQQEEKITVTVTEGRVVFSPKREDSETSVTLSEGYASTLAANGQPTLPQKVDIEKSTGWMQNEIYFEDTPLSEILDQLERWYDVEFEVQDSTGINDRLTVHLANKPLEDHLRLIGELTDIHFARSGKFYRLIAR